MPLSTDVTLPLEHRPTWPARCVKCGQDKPDGIFRMRASRIGWDQLITLGWALGSRPLIEAPACVGCARSLRISRWVRGLLTWIVLIPVMLLVAWVMHRTGLLPTGLHRRWVLAGAMLVAVAPGLIVDAFFPPPLDATARGKDIDYEFRDKAYAEDFAVINNADAE